MGQRRSARTPAWTAAVLALPRGFSGDVLQNLRRWRGEWQLHGHPLLVPLPDVHSSAKHCWEGQVGERRARRVMIAGDQVEGPALLQALMTITVPPLLLTSLSGHMSLPKVWRSSAGPWGAHAPATAALTASLPIQVLRRGDPSESGDLSANADGEGRRAHQRGPAWAPNVSEAAPSWPVCASCLSLIPERHSSDCLRVLMDGWAGGWMGGLVQRGCIYIGMVR